jgi:hypothetical protein
MLERPRSPRTAFRVACSLALLLGTMFAVGCATSPPPRVSSPSASAPAPTKGHFINTTPWAVRVWVDPIDPGNVEGAEPLVVPPDGAAPFDLSIGEHRIVARAVPPGGNRIVGRFDRTIAVEDSRPGWFLRFRQGDFR